MDTSSVTLAGRRSAAARYGAAVLAVALALVARWLLAPYLKDNIPYPAFFLAVTLVAYYAGSGPALLSMVLGLLAADWFFILPIHPLSSETVGDVVGAGSYLAASLAIILASHAMHVAREQALSRRRELEAEVLERQRAEAALQDAKELLEYRVAKRTAQLAESEAHLQTVFRTSPTGIFITRLADGTFLDVNDAYLWTVGYAREEVIGSTSAALNLWVNPDDRSRMVRMLREQGRVEGWEVQFRRKSGEIMALLASVLPIERAGESCILGTITDITEHKRKEEELGRLNRTLRALSRSDRAIMRATSEAEYLEEACRIVIEDCGHAMTWIGFAEEDEARTVRPVAHAGFEEGYLETLKISWADTERGRGPTGTAIRTARPAVCRNMLTDPLFAPWRAEALKRGYASSIVLPLLGADRAFGAITIYSREPDPFSEDEVHLLSELAGDVAYGIGILRLREAHARAEEALRESEAKYRNLFENMTEEVHFWRLVRDEEGRIKTWTLVDANPPTLKTWGKTLEEIRGKTTDEVFGPGARDHYLPVVQRIMTEGVPHSYEDYFPNLDKYFRFTSVPLGDYFITTGADITSIKKAQEALRRQNERLVAARAQAEADRLRLEAVMDALPVGVGIHDAQGAVVRYNRSFGQVWGAPLPATRSVGDYAAYKAWWADTGEALAPEEWAAAQVLATGRAVTGQLVRIQRFDGSHAFVINSASPVRDGAGRLIGSAVAIQDITDLREAEDHLRETRDYLEHLLDYANAPIIVWDPNLAITRFNHAFERLTGRTTDEVIGQGLEILFPADQRAASVERIERAQRGEFLELIEIPILHKTGGVRQVLWNSANVLAADGRTVVATIAQGTDITERKQAEEALRELNQFLEQRVLERTAEVQRLADQLRALAVELTQAESRERRRLAAVLHDHVQQLLVSAQIQLGLVRRADAESIRSTVQGIESIIKEAVSASRSLAVELSPPVLDQAGLAAGLSWLANRMQEKSFFKVHVLADHDAEPATEDVRSLLFGCVRELLLNAVKHSGVQEARVTMERTAEGWTRIVVEDAGKGFDPAMLQATTAADVGFGLFSIQQRLAFIGGRMELESAPGGGTKVSLLAPPARSAVGEGATAARPRAAEAARSSERGKRIHVLIVDDHKIMRQGLVGLLQFEPDMEIVGEAGDGQQAVELAREHRPDVVIMDVNLPVMDGVEATKILAKELPQTKVIGLSMHIDPAVAESMRHAGAVAYLTKEDLSQDLVAAIRACVSRDKG